MAKKDKNIKSEEIICVHCGEKVSTAESVCPSCGLPVAGSDGSVQHDTNKKAKKSLVFPLSMIIIALLIVSAIAVLLWFTIGQKMSKVNPPVMESFVAKQDIIEKFDNLDIKQPEDANDLEYSIEDDDIVKISYEKVVDKNNNIVMNLVMRIAKSTEDIERSIGLSDAKGEAVVFPSEVPIFMNVICDDGTEVPVESYIAVDENGIYIKYMRSTWYDNDYYYSMVTDNLTTKEDFLQEVNRVIIANHVVS